VPPLRGEVISNHRRASECGVGVDAGRAAGVEGRRRPP